MRYLLWGTAAALLAASSTTAGERTWYVSLEAGISDSGIDAQYFLLYPGGPSLPPGTPYPYGMMGDSDESLTFLGAIGAHVTEGLRLELEAGLRSADGQSEMATTQHTLMINAAYDIPVIDRLSVTIGAGGGIDFLAVDTPIGDARDATIAYQALIGLTYEVSKGTNLAVLYRHFDTMDAGFIESGDAGGYVQLTTVEDATLSIGLRFDL
jgi:opacity protein-like surface antigen